MGSGSGVWWAGMAGSRSVPGKRLVSSGGIMNISGIWCLFMGLLPTPTRPEHSYRTGLHVTENSIRVVHVQRSSRHQIGRSLPPRLFCLVLHQGVSHDSLKWEPFASGVYE